MAHLQALKALRFALDGHFHIPDVPACSLSPNKRFPVVLFHTQTQGNNDSHPSSIFCFSLFSLSHHPPLQPPRVCPPPRGHHNPRVLACRRSVRQSQQTSATAALEFSSPPTSLLVVSMYSKCH
jgi:hypothetical protein